MDDTRAQLNALPPGGGTAGSRAICPIRPEQYTSSLMKRISLVLADDRVMVRQGVRALLEREDEFSIVGECGDGLEAVNLVERLQPDVLVLDLMMPSLNGLDVVCHLSQKS